MTTSGAVVLVLCWSFLRIAEFALSERNMAPLLASGGVEHCEAQHRPLLIVNAVVPMLAIAALAWHVRVAASTSLSPWTWVVAVALVAAESLHWWAIAPLGSRWTTGVVVLPGEQPVTRGPYRFLRHPGYTGGATSGALLPLAAGSWVLSVVSAVLLGAIVVARVRCEDAAWLGAAAGFGRHAEGESDES